jgi:hypothetical protein
MSDPPEVRHSTAAPDLGANSSRSCAQSGPWCGIPGLRPRSRDRGRDGGSAGRRAPRAAGALSLIFAALGLAGCARPGYELLGLPLGRTALLPPGTSADESISNGSFRVSLQSRPAAGCGFTTPFFSLRPEGRSVILRTHFPPGEPVPAKALLPDTVMGQQTPVAADQAVVELRNHLAQLAARGCFGVAGPDRILRLVAESVPMSPLSAEYVRFGAPSGGYVDLPPGVRLVETAPLVSRTGEAVGFERRVYLLRTRAQGGARLEPAKSLSRRVGGHSERGAARVSAGLLKFPKRARLFRLIDLDRAILRTRGSMLIAAAGPKALAIGTQRVLSDPETCTGAGGGYWCRAEPLNAVLAAEVEVKVQGRSVWVPLGATVGGALRKAGAPGSLQEIRVLRRYRGALILVRAAGASRIRHLVLLGGEHISWRH